MQAEKQDEADTDPDVENKVNATSDTDQLRQLCAAAETLTKGDAVSRDGSRHLARSNIQAGTSNNRSAAEPLNVQRKTTPSALSTASWIARAPLPASPKPSTLSRQPSPCTGQPAAAGRRRRSRCKKRRLLKRVGSVRSRRAVI